jgi:uncharacterized protein
MSGSRSQLSGAKSESTGSGADPSMEDILASIRRILSEEDLPPDLPAAKAPEPPEPEPPDVLVLDASMLVVATPAQPEHETETVVRQPVVARSPIPPAPPVTVPPAVSPFETPLVERPPVEQPVSEAGPVEVSSTPDITPIAEPIAPPEARTPPGQRDLVPPMDPVPGWAKTEPSMQPEAIPALTPASMAKMAPSPVSRSVTPPILMPVPLSGQILPPPLIKRPEALARDTIFTTTPPPQAEAPPTQNVPPAPSIPPVMAEPRPAAPTITTPETETSPMSASLSSGLASAETTNAAAGSVTNLVRALTSDRTAQVHSGGPTIADLVREEIRPVIKAWLDSNLPPLVERLVRAEIERVISRAQG